MPHRREDNPESLRLNDAQVRALQKTIKDGFAGVAQAIRESGADAGKWRSIQNEVIEKGFLWVSEAITQLREPPEDTSATQGEIDKLTAALKPEADAFEEAAKQNNQE